jgi:hypothetical protein
MNGHKNDFLEWASALPVESISIDYITRIRDFFDFLTKKMQIPLTLRPEKIFTFL